MELQKNHALQGGKYRIIEKIGQGGFAITYKANWTTEVTGPMGKIATDITVAIKEFFFADYCSRDNESSQITISSPTGAQIFDKFKEKLKKEAAILSRLRHPNIVSVLDIFEENNTVYMVMEYVSGGSLKDIIRKNGKLDEPTTLRYATHLCDAVAEIHRNNVLHLDIKPGNILINHDDKVCLIDFGISKQYNSDTHAETSTTPVGISKGFAPTEQYSGVAQFSPATDIYAIGATIYNMCSGNIPPEAMTLLEEDLPPINGISDQLWNAITKAMSVRRNQRPQSIAELMNLLPSTNVAKKAPAQQPASAYEKTQIIDQESVSAPAPQFTPQPAQPITSVASNDGTMVDSPVQQLARDSTQNTPISTTLNNNKDLEIEDDYNEEKPNKNKYLLITATITLLIFVIVFFFNPYFNDYSENESTPCDTTVQITPGKEIDLGLPSGTIWAGWNVGADCAQEFGDSYIWSATKPNHTIGVIPIPPISCTDFDVAYNKTNGEWQLPSTTQFEEIIDICTWDSVNYRGYIGYKITGPNGNSIFLPLTNSILHGIYLTGENELHFTGDGRQPYFSDPICDEMGLIRPVKSK